MASTNSHLYIVFIIAQGKPDSLTNLHSKVVRGLGTRKAKGINVTTILKF